MTLVDDQRSSLVDLRVSDARAAELRALLLRAPNWTLTRRQMCDLELLACGGFSPLRSFLGEQDYLSVCADGRLTDGTLWPMPVTLDIPGRVVGQAGRHGLLALRDPEGDLLAALEIAEAWRPNPRAEAEAVFATTDEAHPGVEQLLHRTNRWYVSGRLEVLKLPEHRQFRDLRRTPDQLRDEFDRLGWDRVVAFQTRNPMHRAHQQLTLRAAQAAAAKLLIHPVVGIGLPGDIDATTRVRCYRALLPAYSPGTVMLSILPLAMRTAGGAVARDRAAQLRGHALHRRPRARQPRAGLARPAVLRAIRRAAVARRPRARAGCADRAVPAAGLRAGRRGLLRGG